jgi:V8-like Glu-specific endopeptidase
VGNRIPRRAAVFFTAALLLASLFPGSASQASPYRPAKGGSGKPVAKDLDPRHKFLASRLTPKAMRAAQPLDLEVKRSQLDTGTFSSSARPEGRPFSVPPTSAVRQSTFASAKGTASTSAGDIPYTSTEIVEPADAPYRTHGKLFMFEGPEPTYVCSATAVNSVERNLVWTAGHCVHEGGPTGEFFDAYAFVPGRRTPTDDKPESDPFGVWFAELAVTTSQWATSTNENVAFKHDVGALVMEDAEGVELVDVVGARGIRFNQNPVKTFRSHGYPAAPPFDGERMFRCVSKLGGVLGRGLLAPMGIGCDMTEGSSGGGWIVGAGDAGFVQSVNSFKIINDPQLEDVMFGPQMRETALEVYEAAGGADTRPPRLTRVFDGPDPFTPLAKKKRKTTIRFTLDETARVLLSIKNKFGATVHKIPATELLPDTYRTVWTGRHFKSGKVVKAGSYKYKFSVTDSRGNQSSKSGRVRVKR